MELFPSRTIFLQLGSLHITWYAILSLLGALICYGLSYYNLRKMGYKKDIIENYFYMMLPIAYIGARLWYCLFEWEKYLYDPIAIFKVWEGGLAFHGGVIAAVLYGVYYARKYGINPRRFADACMPNLLIGQMIGRWGNFINQEAFGSIVSAEYMQNFPNFIKEGMFIAGDYRMPTFLYEGLGNLLGFILIIFVFQKFGRKKRGDMAYAYLTWYGLVRFFVEGLRTDSLMIGPFRIAQLVSLVSIVIGLLGLFGVFDKLFKKTWFFSDDKPVLLFDLDETLLHTGPLIFASYRHVYSLHRPSEELSDDTLRGLLGPTLAEGFKMILPEVDNEQCIREYREYNADHHDEMVTLMPQTKEMLEELKNHGYILGVVSNKIEMTVNQGLAYTGIKDYFDVVIGRDQMEKPKPDPECLLIACSKVDRLHDNLIYVGDAPSDIQTARNIMAFSVAMVFDSYREESLAQAKPNALLHSWEEFIQLLKEDREWSDNSILLL